MPTVNQVFQSAPMGRRILVGTAFTFGVLIVIFGVNLYFAETRLSSRVAPGARVIQMLAPLLPFLIIVPTFAVERSRISKFSIEENSLVLGKKRYHLTGLVDVGRDPEVLRRALRKFGNGGLGSIRGKFWSRRLGSFDAFLSGTENAVVLKWPDKTVAVSPADPDFFIYSARTAAGLA